MRILPTRIHGLLDYLTAIVLIAAPWLLGFAHLGGAAVWVPVLLGILVILYSLVTNYEWGAFRAMPMSMHLMMDIGGGVFLAASPWLFGFADQVYLPHVIVGIFEIFAGLMTETASRTTPSILGVDHGKNEIHA